MGRIPDHLVSLAVRALENRWVTIGAKPDSKRPGKKKGGTPVELDGEGKITKGPAALTGKRPSELSQSHMFSGQDHKSQRKLFAEPGDPPPPPPIDEAPKAPAPAAKKEPKPRAKKPLSMSLLAVIRREGGISSGDFEHADFKEFGLLGALNKKGLSLDDMAATMVRQGHITVPMGKSSPSDHLLQLLKKKTNSLLAADTAEYDKDYEAYMQAREEAQADGYPEEQLAEASGRGEEAGDQESKDRLFEEIFGGDGSGGEEAGRDKEPGDLAGDSAEPAGGVDTSFDFGPAAAPKVEEKPKAKPKATKPEKTAKQDEPAPPAIEPQAATPPPPPATNLFGQPEPTKPQPATTQGLFGEQVPVEDPKVKPRETIADQAEKGLDWLDQKQDPRTDGTGEMFGGLFSPGRTSGATEPEAGPVAEPKVETEPLATARPTVDRRSYAARVEGGETPEQIAGDLEQRYDSAIAARNNPNATQSDKDAAQAEISHIQTVKTQKAHADFAEKMKKKTTDAAMLASVEKPKITVEKSIGYGGKTGEASYLAKISGRHNGKTFNRDFQNGDEDKAAKSNAFRKKKGTYNETHEITPGELYEHAQSGTKKLFAIQPPIGEGTAGHKVYFEIQELKDASKILKSFDNSEVPNANGFGANADFVKPLLSHQHKMAKAAGSYDGLTLPVVARDMEKQPEPPSALKADTTPESRTLSNIRQQLREAFRQCP